MHQVVPHKNVGPKTKLAALDWYQHRAPVHPLTCGNDSQHRVLEGQVTEGGRVYLECPDCDYMQLWFPDHVWKYYLRYMAFGASMVSAPAGHLHQEAQE